jgi:pantoate--beta-alanine ligase
MLKRKTESSSEVPAVERDPHALRSRVRAWQKAGETVGMVPTMGALHAGHLSLIARSASECDRTVATIFVNPTQFGPAEDFGRYPRQVEKDLETLRGRGTDLVFAPATESIYPPGFSTYVEVEGLSQQWEGASRPGHFRGVATVVHKLFQLAPADLAYFGQKDYQQAVIIRRMVADMQLPLEIRVLPIVREPDGLAMSSRNAFLKPDERWRALVLSRSLHLAAELVREGQRDARVVADRMRALIASAEGVALDYATLVHPDTLSELTEITGPAVALVAARVGTTRLIDNEIITLGP